ncbi:hypothetical protein WR25_08823 [Diploscapter pachys]|uniref:Uncharacterized protein n=1 Tax=Diploscapter pachys TaxID=2018661 RepID=A0A2A2KCB5_9BILA|nr:hypothetical protein WR25_08823 [Diploscapter pachys]
MNLFASPIIDYPMRVIINGLAPCLRHQFEQLLDEPWDDVCPTPHSQRLLFVGNFEYGANLEAIEWALEEILPQVWMSNPAVRLAIAGHALPASWKLHWNDPRIEWGASGLAMNNGEHYLGSDDSGQLALLITQLLNQPWRMGQLSVAGRQFARQRHDWSVAAQQLENVHMRLTQLAPAGAGANGDAYKTVLDARAQVLAAGSGLGPVEARRHAEPQGRDVAHAQPAEQVGPRQQAEGHQRRGWVARQADNRHPLVMAEGQRLAWFDRQLPQRQLARFAQGQAKKICLAHRHTASGEDQVDAPQLGQGLTGARKIIGQDPGVDHLAAEALQPADQQAPVAVVDLPRPQWQTRLDQFIAG